MASIHAILQRFYNRTYTNPVVSRARLLLSELEKNYRRERACGIDELLSTAMKSRRVLKGPFKGLIIPRDVGLNAAFYPKLLGTYEQELHPAIESFLAVGGYHAIADVGVAEGYYAVGLALRCPGVPVFAYDIDPRSKSLLDELARANGLEDQIHFEPECPPSSLVGLATQMPRGLLVSDCEGYESDLFDSAVIGALSGWDLIVETHDSSEIRVAKRLAKRFRPTHKVTTVPWHERSMRDFPGSPQISPLSCLGAMDEGRTWRNKWLICSARRRSNGQDGR
jgi:hypothetical protein